MKSWTFFLITVACLLLPLGAVYPSQAASSDTILLTAAEVSSAQDIEAAIRLVTADGARSGTVILDGSEGPFVFSQTPGNDHTINIFNSNLTLQGINNAHIIGEGIFFDALDVHHIVIRDMKLTCSGDCIVSWGMHRDVLMQNLRLRAQGIGIQVAQTDGWQIKANRIQSSGAAIHLLDVAEVIVTHNRLRSAHIAIMLQGAHSCRLRSNQVQSTWQGVLLGADSRHNRVLANSITGVASAGISLEPGISGNRVHGNYVQCDNDHVCQTIDASEATLLENEVSGNRSAR